MRIAEQLAWVFPWTGMSNVLCLLLPTSDRAHSVQWITLKVSSIVLIQHHITSSILLLPPSLTSVLPQSNQNSSRPHSPHPQLSEYPHFFTSWIATDCTRVKALTLPWLKNFLHGQQLLSWLLVFAESRSSVHNTYCRAAAMYEKQAFFKLEVQIISLYHNHTC